MQNPATAPIPAYDGPADNDTQQYWLDVAWRSLQSEDRTIVSRIESGELDAPTVADVVTAAARRVLRNPNGLKVSSGAVDDYQESATFADATEDVYFTAAELRRLLATDPTVMTGWSGSFRYC